MDSRRVLYFLNTVRGEAKGQEAELAALYNRAIEEDDNVKYLKYVLNNYSFFKDTGREIYEKAAALPEKLNKEPDKALDILLEIKQAHEFINKEAARGNAVFESPFPTTELFSVLNSKNILCYTEALRMTASICVYLILLYGEAEEIRGLGWNERGGLMEKFSAVNMTFLPALNKVSDTAPSWIITRKNTEARSAFLRGCFCIEYCDREKIRHISRIYMKERMGTHSFLNIKAYETGEPDIPYAWGTGNIVSATPDTALFLLQNDIVTNLRSPRRDEYIKKMPKPSECLKLLSEGRNYCISPEDLLITMNRWNTAHTIFAYKAMHLCLICGSKIKSGTCCKRHFVRD